MTSPPTDRAPRDAVAVELARVVDRLRTFSLERLDEPAQTDLAGGSRRQRAHDAAQTLADLAAQSQGRPPRPLPQLAVHAVPDQLVVTGQDLLAEGNDVALCEAVQVLAALRATL